MKRLIKIGKSIRQLLDDCNNVLIKKNMATVTTLKELINMLSTAEINRLPYLLQRNIMEVYETDLSQATTIKASAFKDCTNLTSITIPDSVTSIGSYAFEYCTGLTNITIPNNIEIIGSSAFNGCTSLPSITIPSGIINNYAFYSCSYLRTITLGERVTSIGSYALRTTNRSTIYLYATTPPVLADTTALYPLKIFVPDGCGAIYKTATNWSVFSDYIVEGF